jgi:hypothetical protein
LEFLRQHPEVATVTIEFQTGARANQQTAEEIFSSLGNLLTLLDRPLHCILVGAGRFYKEALARRWNFTVVDSAPYMRALAREVLSKDTPGRFRWKKLPTQKGAPLYGLFEASLKLYERSLRADPEKPRARMVEDRKQMPILC